MTNEEIRKILDNTSDMLPEEAIPLLDSLLSDNECEEAFLQRGMKHWAMGHRALAINDYLAAIRLNPDSKAVKALESANAILDYYNKDIYNP